MGLPLRSYELFESGEGRLDLERLFAFAEATDSDPFAIPSICPFQISGFAVACADTKLALIMVMHLQGFYQERGDDITYLDPPISSAGSSGCSTNWAGSSMTTKLFCDGGSKAARHRPSAWGR
jgi:hypothetical protein